jgi:adenylate cyclase
MLPRPFDEIREAVQAAIRINDAAALLTLATELDTVATPEAQALAHRIRGWAMLLRDNYAKALEHSRAALALYEALGDRAGQAVTLGNIGSALCRTGDYPEALNFHRRALTISEETGDRRGVARASGNLAAVMLECGDYDAAMTNYQGALALNSELGELNSVALVTGSIGIIYYNLGDYRTALEHFQRSLSMHAEHGDRGAVARSLGNIGNVYAALGDYPAALENYRRSYAVHHDLGEQASAAHVLANIGNTYFSTGDYPVALEYLQQSLSIYEDIESRRGIAYVLVRIGTVHLRTGQSATALAHFQRAHELYEQLGEPSHLANATRNIGEVYQQMGNTAAAIEHFQRSLLVSEQLGERSNIARSLILLIGLHFSEGNDAQAKELLAVFDTLQLDEPYHRILRHTYHAYVQELNGDLDAAHASLLTVMSIAQEHGLRPSIATAHQRLRDLAFKRNDLAGYVEHNNEYTRINEEINGKETTTKLAMQAKQREIDAKDREHQKHLAVLHSTLPKEVADRVARGEVVNDYFDNATVIFLDIVGFTEISSSMSSQEVIALLDDVFTQCDAICAKHGVTKIKTIGDSYMAVAFDSIMNAAQCAVEMSRIQYRIQNTEFNPAMLQYRIGVHCGPVTAGVIGKERMQYDVWGDTVNVASRMESSGEAGRVHVSEAVALKLEEQSRIKDQESHEVSLVTRHSSLVTIDRGSIDVKGKGMMNTYWLEGR